MGEQRDTAEVALQELCHHYLSCPHDLRESHSFHWSGVVFGRLWAFFGPPMSSTMTMTPDEGCDPVQASSYSKEEKGIAPSVLFLWDVLPRSLLPNPCILGLILHSYSG